MKRRLLQKYRELILYVIFGAATTLVSMAVFSLAQKLFAPPLTDAQLNICNAVSWAAAVSFAFVTNKLFVFESKSWRPALALREAAAFLGSRLFSGAVELLGFPLLLKLGLDRTLFGIEGFWAKAAITVIVIVLNYVLSKLLVFRKKDGEP